MREHNSPVARVRRFVILRLEAIARRLRRRGPSTLTCLLLEPSATWTLPELARAAIIDIDSISEDLEPTHPASPALASTIDPWDQTIGRTRNGHAA